MAKEDPTARQCGIHRGGSGQLTSVVFGSPESLKDREAGVEQ